jgi:hypothetical protein
MSEKTYNEIKVSLSINRSETPLEQYEIDVLLREMGLDTPLAGTDY